MELLILIVGLLVCIACLVILIKSTKNKSKYGVNLKGVTCPNCGTSLNKIRRPENIHQALWGGWTCPNCGSEINKWGEIRKIRKQLENPKHEKHK